MICYMARVLKVSPGTPFKSLWVGAHKKAVTALVTTKAVDQCGHGVGGQADWREAVTSSHPLI